MELYHIDKSARLSAGQLDYLDTDTKFDIPEAKELMGRMFPDGVSPHGIFYLRTPKLIDRQRGTVTGIRKAYYLEIVAESVRRLEFPEIPSRFISMFGSGTVKEALAFAAAYRSYAPDRPYRVWNVDAERASRHDMKWLKVQGSYIHQAYYMQKYWEGAASDEPAWEYLMTGKIVALEEVEELRQEAGL